MWRSFCEGQPESAAWTNFSTAWNRTHTQPRWGNLYGSPAVPRGRRTNTESHIPGPNLDLPPHLVTERCQVGRRLLPNSSYLCGRHQSEDVLDRGGRVPPELVPEGVVWGLHRLQAEGTQTHTANDYQANFKTNTELTIRYVWTNFVLFYSHIFANV